MRKQITPERIAEINKWGETQGIGMTTEQEPAEPCSWCGQSPEWMIQQDRVRHGHHFKRCVFGDLTPWYVNAWNIEQRSILAQRKADFIAGFKARGRIHEIDYRGWSQADPMFEDYLAEERGKE